MDKVYLVRYSSEIFTKGEGLKRQLIYALYKNISDALERAGIKSYVKRDRDRVYVFTDEDVRDVIKKVFGVSSFSPSLHTRYLSLNDLKLFIRENFGSIVKGKEFAVRVKVRDKNISSRFLERELGSVLYDLSKGVNLESPDVQVNVEIRGEDIYAYTETIRGYGGFPVGTQGKAISLISGGFDSAVSSWMALRRGLKVFFVLFDMGGKEHVDGVLSLVRKLYNDWIYGYEPSLYVLEFWPLLRELSKVKPKYRLIILKRIMYRLGEILAKNLNAECIITGESLGQVSTQTLHNLRIIEESINIPVFRPLIFHDKEEIIDLARRIGTYEISERIPEFCAIAPAPPPRANLQDIVREEKKVMNVIDTIINSAKRYDMQLESFSEDGLFIKELPKNAEVIDLEKVDFYDVLDKVQTFDRNKVYVFICREGMKSRQMAKILRDMGFKAYYTS